MLQSGTLKKRRRRNLSKVNGLTTYQYDEKMDNFNVEEVFAKESVTRNLKTAFWTRGDNDTRLNLSGTDFAEYRKENSGYSAKARVTRNPIFHRIFSSKSENNLNDMIEEQSGQGNFQNEDVNKRTHFLDIHLMTRFKQIIWLGKTSGAFPWKWNEKSYTLDKWGPSMEKIWSFIWFGVLLQTSCLFIYQVYTFWNGAMLGNKSYRDIFVSSYSLQFYGAGLDYNLIMFLYGEKIRHYINTMLKFNYEMVKKYVIHLDGYQDGARMFVFFSSINSFAQVPIKMLNFWMAPFLPIYLFSYISPQPWYWLIPGLIQEYYFVAQVIAVQVLITWLVMAHTNTLQFWLKEIHNHNDSDWTSDDLRTPKNSLETFKSLQVLNLLFNECVAPLILPITKVHFFNILVSCGYVVIRSMNSIFFREFPQILTYPMAVINLSIDGFLTLNMSAQIYDFGISFIDTWSRTKSKEFRKVLMSCSSPKVRVGRFYFITVSTTISFFKVAWDYVTNAIVTLP